MRFLTRNQIDIAAGAAAANGANAFRHQLSLRQGIVGGNIIRGASF